MQATTVSRWRILRTVDGTRPASAVLAFVLWSLGYAVFFVLLEPVLGVPYMALLMLPAAAAGWYFGAARGTFASVFVVLMNAGLIAGTAAGHGMAAAAAPGAIPGGLMTVISALVVGLFRERTLALTATKEELRSRLEERERMEAASSLRLTALEAAPVGIVITDPTGIIEWVNPRFSEMTGYAPSEAVGRHTRLLSSGKQAKAFYRELWSTVLAGDTWHGRLTNRRKDGTEYVEEMEITPVRIADGTIGHFVAAKVDVSERERIAGRIEDLNASLSRQLQRLQALHEIDRITTSGPELGQGLAAFVEAVRSGLGVDAASTFILGPSRKLLRLNGHSGFQHSAAPDLAVPVGAGMVGRAAAEGRVLMAQGKDGLLEAIEPTKAATLAAEGFLVVAAVPMVARGELRGVLFVGHRSLVEVSVDWLDALGEVATQGAILVDSVLLLSALQDSNRQLKETYDETIEGWSRALDLRDKETEGHSRRVTAITLLLAEAMGIDDAEREHMRRGALLHDIGKMGVPDAILQKPGPLSQDEWAVMRTHPVLARELLRPIAFLRPALDIPYSHHERWDGGGYPLGLKGLEIPLAARIFAVADVYDALTSDRPYRAAWSRKEALDHIREEAGTHFDPRVVAAFMVLEDADGAAWSAAVDGKASMLGAAS